MFARPWRDRRGNVSLIAAVTLPVVVGVSGLGAEYGYGVVTRVENQRVADLTAYGGAVAYSSTQTTAAMNNAVSRLAGLNGFASSDVTAAVVTSPSGDGNNAIQSTVTTTAPRVLSRVFGGSTTMTIHAQAWVEIVPASNPACILALKPTGTGVTLSGGTSVTATSCVVASDSTAVGGSVTVPNGTSITSPIIDSATAVLSTSKSNIHAASGSVTYNISSTADPLNGATTVTALTTHLAGLKTQTGPSAPTVTAPTAPATFTVPTGTAINFTSYTHASTNAMVGLPTGCTGSGTKSGSNYVAPWTVNCTGQTSYAFGVVSNTTAVTNINFTPTTTAITATFAGWGTPGNGVGNITITGNANNNYKFIGDVTNTYLPQTFPAGNYFISGSVPGTNNNSAALTFGAGTFNIGGSINPAAALTFGAGTFNVGGSVTTSYGGLTFGSTTTTTNMNVVGNITTSATTTFGNGTYNIGGNLVTGGTTTFGTLASTTNFNVGGYFSLGGTTSFGAGTYNIAKGITTGGGSTTPMGAGTFNIGSGSPSCSFSICHTGSLMTLAGPAIVTLQKGISVGGGETVTMGNGSSANSYTFGGGTSSDAILVGGSGVLTLGDVSGTGHVFQMTGNIDLGGGGSCTTLPAAGQHDISGSFMMAGGTILGAGTYSVLGYVALGANGGGAVSCGSPATSIGMKGQNITLVVGGTNAASGTVVGTGGCANMVFCITAGYSNVTLTAPTASNLAVIGPTTASGITSGALLTAGATGASVSGAFYFPNGAFTMGGGSSLGGGTNQCLEMIASQVTLTGGSAMASACAGIAGTAGGNATRMVLVQ